MVSSRAECPKSKALQASKKGLCTAVLNEDTVKTRGLWARAKSNAALIYCSPEMALSSSFAKLWTDIKFRGRVTAVIVDEAHCIEEWGDDDFRPQYRKLEELRCYTGLEVPFVACTATCTTSTFELLWSTLDFGHRPFWGLDVGVGRPNLFFQTQKIENTEHPILDVLDIFPETLTSETKKDDIPKCFFYFDTEPACRQAVHFIRKFLPEHLRQAIQPFSSSISSEGKNIHWDDFQSGKTRVLCATDAAGMGCNVSDVKYVVSFGIPKSIGQVFQRWGRAGRNRVLKSTCIALVPSWAIRPSTLFNPSIHRVAASSKAIESKQDTLKRANLPPTVEQLLNLGAPGALMPVQF